MPARVFAPGPTLTTQRPDAAQKLDQVTARKSKTTAVPAAMCEATITK